MEDVEKIRRAYFREGLSIREIGRTLHHSQRTIRRPSRVRTRSISPGASTTQRRAAGRHRVRHRLAHDPALHARLKVAGDHRTRGQFAGRPGQLFFFGRVGEPHRALCHVNQPSRQHVRQDQPGQGCVQQVRRRHGKRHHLARRGPRRIGCEAEVKRYGRVLNRRRRWCGGWGAGQRGAEWEPAGEGGSRPPIKIHPPRLDAPHAPARWVCRVHTLMLE